MIFSVFVCGKTLVTIFTFEATNARFLLHHLPPAPTACSTMAGQHALRGESQATGMALENIAGPVLCTTVLVQVLEIE